MKRSHAEVDYQHPAEGKDHCAQCRHYIGPPERGGTPHCEGVVDPIRPQDWCARFKRALYQRKESK
jgi:hypothetical protein